MIGACANPPFEQAPHIIPTTTSTFVDPVAVTFSGMPDHPFVQPSSQLGLYPTMQLPCHEDESNGWQQTLVQSAAVFMCPV